jgi:hypothetical protein
MNTRESHQRKLVDGSDPFYKKSAVEIVNPPNGSWGIVQIQPTKGVPSNPWNPPNGSWGIVQILPSHSGDLENSR